MGASQLPCADRYPFCWERRIGRVIQATERALRANAAGLTNEQRNLVMETLHRAAAATS
jgi:hypothetical protein